MTRGSRRPPRPCSRPRRRRRCVLLRHQTSSGCWLRLTIRALSCTSLQSLPKAGLPGTCSVNLHHAIIVCAGQQTVSAFHKFSWPFLCASLVLHPCPFLVCPYLIPFLLDTLCCECKDGMCPLCCQCAQITQTSSAFVVVIGFSVRAPVVILGECTTFVLGIGPSSYYQHALCPLNAAHSCC